MLAAITAKTLAKSSHALTSPLMSFSHHARNMTPVSIITAVLFRSRAPSIAAVKAAAAARAAAAAAHAAAAARAAAARAAAAHAAANNIDSAHGFFHGLLSYRNMVLKQVFLCDEESRLIVCAASVKL